ncbi:phosphotransferase [Kribbella pittospori]|uniref:phosphotransferase n=1 Tax=Kribbella pittospori TaxID=722689 RepID=UPI00192DD815|nr:phosphotransferase [Kribbella pittospori]
MAPRHVTRDQLAGAARAALGGGRRLEVVERLTGGTTKGVYRLTMDDATTAIAYLWNEAENYWPATDWDGDLANPFSPGRGLDLYETVHARLDALGLRVPIVYLTDRDRTHYPADIAIVEDFPGDDLEERFVKDPRAVESTMDRLREALETMRVYRAPTYGKIAHIDRGGTPRGSSCEGVVLEFALRCVGQAAERDPRVAKARDRLEERLRELAAAVQPRTEYSVVHGELGLGHVMVDRDGVPVLIDVEEMMYFDVEWEHAFMRNILGDDYPQVAVPDLDEDRLALYTLAEHISLTAGPLRLLDGDYPNRAFMQRIIEYNLGQALLLAQAQP